MCGIAGIISINGPIDHKASSLVREMNKALLHRGPDEDGFYQNQQCALAMRRLSIIDLKKGRQPIWNENKDVSVFFNGEIYNYRELKQDLLRSGHTFKTDTDTEVLVHLYEEYGDDMVNHLKGMFAFCIYDKKNESFMLARDRFGEKPLYYYRGENSLTFSSEVASLLENVNIPRKLNKQALPYYLRTSLVPEPLTLLDGVMCLSAGNILKVSSRGVTIKPYFNLDYSVEDQVRSMDEAKELIKPLLAQAVRRQSTSDVPMGAFLSGGIDSSTMVAQLQEQSKNPINTFNVRFEDQEYDESAIARRVASYCGTNHEEVVVPNMDFDESLFWEIIEHVGLPFRDSSAIPTYLVSKAIGQHIKVAISGDGGDELFGGYSLFNWYLKIHQARKAPKLLRKMLLQTVSMGQSIKPNSSMLRQLHRGIHTSLLPETQIPISLNGMFTSKEIREVLMDSDEDLSFPLLMDMPPQATTWTPLRRIMFYRMHHTLTANMLVKVDRMSMANSLEVRAPFLDPDLFEASKKIPDEFLMSGGVGKRIIREIMKDKLPKEVFDHPKQGFNLPLHNYRNAEFRALAKNLLLDQNPSRTLFDHQSLHTIFRQGMGEVKQPKSSVFLSSHKLWMMMQLFGWMRKFKIEE